MKNRIREWWRFWHRAFIFRKNWKYLRQAHEINEKPLEWQQTHYRLTKEEIKGVEDLDAVYRLFSAEETKTIKSELKVLIDRIKI